MKKLLVLGSSNGTVEIVKKAKEMKLYTIVTDNLPFEKSPTKVHADDYWQISTGDLDALEEKCRKENINGVIAGASDFNQEQSILLCKRLGLPHYCSKETWHYSRDKADFKRICKKVGAPIPEEYTKNGYIAEEDLQFVPLPAIVKPIDLAGNVGVSYCYTHEDLHIACHEALSLSKSKKLVVEQMLHGEEWIVYYAMAEGEISLLGMNRDISQPGMKVNANCITTTLTDHIGQYLVEVNDYVIRVLKEIGSKDGLAWVQVMRNKDGRFYIIEMGYRFGGDIIFIPYKEIRDFDGIQWVIECAIGVEHKAKDLPEPQNSAFEKCACVYSLWPMKAGTLQSFNGLENYIHNANFIVYTSLKKGQQFEAWQMVGIIVFSAQNCDEMCEIIAKINSDVEMIDENGENVMLYYQDMKYLRSLQ